MNNPLVQPDPGLFIWTILTFLVLLGLLGKFAWRPLLQALERRQEIRESAGVHNSGNAGDCRFPASAASSATSKVISSAEDWGFSPGVTIAPPWGIRFRIFK